MAAGVEEESMNQEFIDKSRDKSKVHTSSFRLGILPFDPLFVWIALTYGLTR